jgi:hypothetical protein
MPDHTPTIPSNPQHSPGTCTASENATTNNSSSSSSSDGGSAETGPNAAEQHVATGAGVDTGAGTTRPKTEAELEADRRYEEAIEEEYAKREGGA